jgi:hypothetical protein
VRTRNAECRKSESQPGQGRGTGTQKHTPLPGLNRCASSWVEQQSFSIHGIDQLSLIGSGRLTDGRSVNSFRTRSGSRKCGDRVVQPFNLYGFPTARFRPSSHCSLTRLCNFGRFHHRQSATLPLAREDISHEKNRSRSKRSSSPTGPDAITKSTLWFWMVQYGVSRENTRLVGQGN